MIRLAVQRQRTWVISAFCVLAIGTWVGCSQSKNNQSATIEDFVAISGTDVDRISEALDRISRDWPEGTETMLIESLRFIRETKPAFEVPLLLDEKANIRSVKDVNSLFVDIWSRPYKPHPNYASFKAKLYAQIDPSFEEYFNDDYETTIRLDEIRWGGVQRDGIPPLKDPDMITADKANYLDDSNVVFGVYLNGAAKCYPKRILACHEMVKDTVGSVRINGVYCTLCGSMIVYLPEIDGRHYELGTSGFLFRSNKLMYDHETKSLWSTMKGEPVVGPLVGKGIKLKRHHVVTTTWGQWKKDNPDTLVLSLNTGHERDYSEGAAYRQYFATDDLMFSVPKRDPRLKNKAEVLALIFDSRPDEQLAISAAYLNENRVYHDTLAGQSFVVLTDLAGGNRVYATSGQTFSEWADDRAVLDNQGNRWIVGETQLALETDESKSLGRLPAHRAFWFGWRSAFPDTRLVR